jgi:hypothetical protein
MRVAITRAMRAGREFTGGGQDPFACLVVLADDGRAFAGPVVHRLLHLAFDEGVLLLDHQDVRQPAREVAQAHGFQRPGHRDLVDADAEVGAGARVEVQVFQGLQHVEVGLAGGDDAQARIGRIDDDAVDAVGARKGLRGLHRVLVQAHLLVHRRVRPADVEAAARHLEIFRQHDAARERIDVDRGRGLHRFGDRLEPDPASRVTRHRPADEAEVEDVLHARRIEHRHHRADEFVFRAVRQRGAAAGVVVGRQREHAALGRGAGRVGMLEHVARAVDARSLAVPHAEHAFDLRTREQVGLLRAPHHRRAEVFVEARHELHARRFQVLACAPQFEVEATERRAAVTAHEPRGVQAGGLVAQAAASAASAPGPARRRDRCVRIRACICGRACNPHQKPRHRRPRV